jgi:hypothetical protein
VAAPMATTSARSTRSAFDDEVPGTAMIMRDALALHHAGHCGETEACVADVYCNCSCDRCRHQVCFRLGCADCGKIHTGDRRWIGLAEHRGSP